MGMAEGKYVVFRLADELYGLPIDSVERILEDQTPVRIPRTPKMVLGVFDLRGETIGALDLRARFEFPESKGESNMVVVNCSAGRCALRVDGVEGIYDFAQDQIEASPTFTKGQDDAFLAGVGKRGDKLIVMLDIEHLIPEKVSKQLVTSGKKAA